MYPTGCSAPNSMGFPRFTSQTPPQAYSVQQGIGHLWNAKVLTKIIKPLVGRSPQCILSTQDFVEQANKVPLLPRKWFCSYDATVLFTSVPVEPALSIIKDLLEKGNTLKERMVLLVKDIILLLEFCLHNTFFSFQGQFYE